MKIKTFKLKDLKKHLEESGIMVKLPFSATNFESTKDPKIKFKDNDEKEFKFKIVQTVK